jgi:serine/threonine protein kinase/beta-lactam-binding protein with PASTA domain
MIRLIRPTIVAMDKTLARRPVGQLLDGRYRLESHLADGGMASIYLGTDMRLDRTVALKVMRAEFSNDEDFVRRFVAEARAVARLSHPNVVTVYDQGADGRTLYLAMEYVPGRNLRSVLRERGRLAPHDALEVMSGVLGGLAAAHEAGLAHRDVKPENVLITSTSQVKVADFGLARLVTGTAQTKSGMIIGTAAYLSPEQVLGGVADARTDVYAAGIMLFELLTGYQPHTGESPLAVAYKHVNEVVPPPSSLVPELPPALDALVAMATSRDPDLRPTDAGQFLRAVADVQRRLPAVAAPLGYPTAPIDGSAVHDTPPAGVIIPNSPSPWRGQPSRGPGPVPGMADAARYQAPGPGGPVPPQDGAADLYLPVNNKTLIVSGPDQATVAGPGPGYGRSREPRLQRLLFSRRLAYLTAGVAVMVVIALAGWWLLAGRYATVPRLTGMTAAAATSDLRGLGFDTAIGKAQLDNKIAKGEVIRSEPAAGTKLTKGGRVTLILSAGPHMIAVPQVTGQAVATAEAGLRRAGLVLGRVKRHTSATIPAGIVLATRPPAGTSWPQPRPVTLVVSAGPPVPNFVGQPKQVAESWANTNGVSLNEVPDTRSSAPPGTVLRQSVAPGSPFTAHEVITITYAEPQMAPVPNVDGMSVQQAKHTLQQAGFKVQVVQRGPFHMVFGYSPTGQAPQGSTITIYVGF